MDKKEYSLTEHYHRYACWAAAHAVIRAVNRVGLGLKTSFISELLVIGKPSQIMINKQEVTTINLLDKVLSINKEDEFKKYHIEASKSIIKALKDITGKKDYTYGIAAKIIGIYFKTIILSKQLPLQKKLMKIIHPPIDSILLKNIVKENNLKQKNIKNVKWSKLNEEDYWALIEILKKEEYPINWKLEKYWVLSD